MQTDEPSNMRHAIQQAVQEQYSKMCSGNPCPPAMANLYADHAALMIRDLAELMGEPVGVSFARGFVHSFVYAAIVSTMAQSVKEPEAQRAMGEVWGVLDGDVPALH